MGSRPSGAATGCLREDPDPTSSLPGMRSESQSLMMGLRARVFRQVSMEMLKVKKYQNLSSSTILIQTISVIDLFDAGEFSSLRKTNGYSNVRQIAGKSLI